MTVCRTVSSPGRGIARGAASASASHDERAGTTPYAAFHADAVHKALTFMRDNLAEFQGLTDHARAASMSPYHFHRVFRSVTGVTPGRFLTSLRLAEAKRLLLSSTMSTTHIGHSVGYLSSGTFATQFARLVGVPPKRFRMAGQKFGGEPVATFLAWRQDADPEAHGRVLVHVGPRPDSREECVALAAFPTGIPQDRPTACALVLAGHGGELVGVSSTSSVSPCRPVPLCVRR
jgi:AraC-like DNA-binding protein